MPYLFLIDRSCGHIYPSSIFRLKDKIQLPALRADGGQAQAPAAEPNP